MSPGDLAARYRRFGEADCRADSPADAARASGVAGDAGLLALIEGSLPSGRYRASEVVQVAR